MLIAALVVAIQLAFIARALTRSHRDPTSRLAWIAIIAFIPLGGAIGYILFGEINIGSRLRTRQLQVRAGVAEALNQIRAYEVTRANRPSEDWSAPFQTGWSVNRFRPVPCASAELISDSNEAIDRIVRDIDAAKTSIHIVFYIWLPDRNGTRVAEALIRAASRGIICRALVDDLGSRALVRSPLWKKLEEGGVKLARALSIGNPILRALSGRIDLRNHRKIIVIDGDIGYCGSQNCADPEFLPKAKFGPWVDIQLRVEGTIVRQLDQIFASDWLTFHEEDSFADLVTHTPPADNGFPAQIIATGPTIRYGAMSDTFLSVIHFARKRLTITTPYYVPSTEIQNAICAAARRGVETTMILPARNDDRIVGPASRSHYRDLLTARVRIFEYTGGLLHTKSITVDGEFALVGSANIDRRSLELNYENNMFLQDPDLTGALEALQRRYAETGRAITLDEVLEWRWYRRLFYNAAAMMSPLL